MLVAPPTESVAKPCAEVQEGFTELLGLDVAPGAALVLLVEVVEPFPSLPYVETAIRANRQAVSNPA